MFLMMRWCDRRVVVTLAFREYPNEQETAKPPSGWLVGWSCNEHNTIAFGTIGYALHMLNIQIYSKCMSLRTLKLSRSLFLFLSTFRDFYVKLCSLSALSELSARFCIYLARAFTLPQTQRLALFSARTQYLRASLPYDTTSRFCSALV